MLSELVVVSLTMMLVFVVVVVVADICLVPLRQLHYPYDNYITPTTITLLHFVKLVGLLTQDNLEVSSFVPFVMSW
jgi:hypothetical protein